MEDEGERIAAAINQLGDVLLHRIAAWIEVMESAGIKFGRHPSQVDICILEGVVRCSSQASSVRHGTVYRFVTIDAPIVRGGGTIGRAGGDNVVYTLCDNAVLKHRFVEIGDIIANDVAFKALLDCVGICVSGKSSERANVVGEAELARISRSKSDSSFRRHIVNDLTHAAALIGCVWWANEILQHDNRLGVGGVAGSRQILRSDIRSGGGTSTFHARLRIETIRHDPDRHSGSIPVERNAGVIE